MLATSCASTSASPDPQADGAPSLTAEQKEFLSGVGSWDGTITAYMPGQDPNTVAAHEEVVAVGDFWTHSRFTCIFMGQPYTGTGILGYDPATKSYQGTWSDSMSSYLAVMKGHRDAATNAVVMEWEAPNMEGKITRQRSETVRSGDSYTITFYEGEGKGTKHMVIAMKRK